MSDGRGSHPGRCDRPDPLRTDPMDVVPGIPQTKTWVYVALPLLVLAVLVLAGLIWGPFKLRGRLPKLKPPPSPVEQAAKSQEFALLTDPRVPAGWKEIIWAMAHPQPADALPAGWQDLAGRIPPRAAESGADRYAELARAFAGPPPAAAPPVHQAVDRMLGLIRSALESGDREQFDGRFDFVRLFLEIHRLSDQADASAGRPSAVRALARQIGLPLWSRHEVRLVEPLAGGQEAVAYVKTFSPGGVVQKRRLWIVRHPDGWRCYDTEDAEIGIRHSALMAAVEADFGEGFPAWFVPWIMLQEAERAAAEGAAAADRLMAQVAPVSFPGPIEGYKYVILGSLAAASRRHEDALAAYVQAAKAHPGMPTLHYLGAVSHNRLGDGETALRHLEAYTRLFGREAHSASELGRAFVLLGQKDDAAQAFRDGLKADPESIANLAGLATVLAPGGAAELQRHFAALPAPRALFHAAAQRLYRDGAGPALAGLIDAFDAHSPGDGLADFYRARLHRLGKQYARAATLFLAAYPRLAAPRMKQFCIEEFVEAMYAAGKGLDAYRAAPVRRAAFRLLSKRLVHDRDEANLDTLLAEHRKADPEDPWLDFYAGEMHVLRGDFGAAERALRHALAGKLPAGWRGQFQEALVYAMFRGGKALEALRTVEPHAGTFQRLADLAFRAGDGGTLQDIVAARRGQDPADKTLALWHAKALFLRGRYDQTVQFLRDNWQAAGEADDLEPFDDLLVRSLVRVGRLDEAVKHAARITARTGDPWYEAVAYAAAGDLANAAQAFAACLRHHHRTADFYDDPDIAAALASEALAPLRKQYPPPAADTQPATQP